MSSVEHLKKDRDKMSNQDQSERNETGVARREGADVATSERKSHAAVINEWLDQATSHIEQALSGRIEVGQFKRECLTAFRSGGPGMMKVEPRSFVAACMEAALVGVRLDRVLGEGWIIPRRNNKSGITLAQFQLGYPGAIKLAVRGSVVKVEARVVFEDEHSSGDFDWDYGTSPFIKHKPHLGVDPRGRSVFAAYAVATFASGETQFEIVDRPELDRTAAASKNPVWRQHFVPMSRKTAVLRLRKYLPNHDEVAMRALRMDDLRDQGIEAGFDDSITVEQMEGAA